jgi:hypothetical protein
VLYYSGEEENINVIRFFYNKRDWVNLLKEKTIEEFMNDGKAVGVVVGEGRPSVCCG